MADFVNVGAAVAIPVINAMIPQIEIPHEFNNTLVIQNATFTAGDNFAYISMSPIVNV